MSLLQNWIFLSLVSSIATGALITLSAAVLGGLHPAIIMAIRIAGALIVTIPIIVLSINNGKSGTFPVERSATEYIFLLIGVAVMAAVSWYSFYEALASAKTAGQSSAAVTAINYTSVVVVLAFDRIFLGYQFDWRNWLGAALVAAGAYLVCLRSPA